jgi:hypothetical protein
MHYEQNGQFHEITADEGMVLDREDASGAVGCSRGATFVGFKKGDTTIVFTGGMSDIAMAALKLDLYHCQLPNGLGV